MEPQPCCGHIQDLVVETASMHAANSAVVVDRRYSWCETCCYSSSCHCQRRVPPEYTQQDTGNCRSSPVLASIKFLLRSEPGGSASGLALLYFSHHHEKKKKGVVVEV